MKRMPILFVSAECRPAPLSNLRHAATIISRGVRTRGFGLPVKQAISSTCYVTSSRLGHHSMSRFIRDLLPSLRLFRPSYTCIGTLAYLRLQISNEKCYIFLTYTYIYFILTFNSYNTKTVTKAIFLLYRNRKS